MVDVKPILRAGTAVQALALVGRNVQVARRKKKRVGDLIGLAGENIVGTALLKEQSDFIGGL